MRMHVRNVYHEELVKRDSNLENVKLFESRV